ncbi:9480_t:CDS:2 [Gigaspora margarita]|uniref:9480_t:CDS:1 n=1 Tax=Gigaspora margarita TaxID=4874 RepID=A0ABM8W432_GIGMA|nr:9480_t:CDS:2 [Gigaspora margarita]
MPSLGLGSGNGPTGPRELSKNINVPVNAKYLAYVDKEKIISFV